MTLQEQIEQAWELLPAAKKDAPFSERGRIRVVLLMGRYKILVSKRDLIEIENIKLAHAVHAQ